MKDDDVLVERIIGPGFEGLIESRFDGERWWPVRWTRNLAFVARGASRTQIRARCEARGWKLEPVYDQLIPLVDVNSFNDPGGRVRLRCIVKPGARVSD